MIDTCDRNGFITKEGAKAIINKALEVNPTKNDNALSRLQFLDLQMNAVESLRGLSRELSDAIETWQNSTTQENNPEDEEMGRTFNPTTDEDFVGALRAIVRKL